MEMLRAEDVAEGEHRHAGSIQLIGDAQETGLAPWTGTRHLAAMDCSS